MNAPTDHELYLEMQERMRRMRAAEGAGAIDRPEYQAAWRCAETVKNRHGGLPPPPASSAGIPAGG